VIKQLVENFFRSFHKKVRLEEKGLVLHTMPCNELTLQIFEEFPFLLLSEGCFTINACFTREGWLKFKKGQLKITEQLNQCIHIKKSYLEMRRI